MALCLYVQSDFAANRRKSLPSPQSSASIPTPGSTVHTLSTCLSHSAGHDAAFPARPKFLVKSIVALTYVWMSTPIMFHPSARNVGFPFLIAKSHFEDYVFGVGFVIGGVDFSLAFRAARGEMDIVEVLHIDLENGVGITTMRV